MLHIPEIGNYLNILTDDEVWDFVAINFGEYFKSTKEKLCTERIDEQNYRTVTLKINLQK